jgi:phosphoglycerate kinase
MQPLRQLDVNKNIQGLKVLLRVDFNVPLQNQQVSDATKIVKVKPIIHSLLARGAKVILCSHLGRPQKKGKTGFSLSPIKQEAEKIIGTEIEFITENYKATIDQKIKDGKKIFLLENLRFDPGEEKDSDSFSQLLADTSDLYINEAFSCSHRAHASIHGITKFIDSYAGETIAAELKALNAIMLDSKKPVTCIIGGSKISTKIDLIINLLPKIDFMIIGGAMANNFFQHDGHNIGKSKIEDKIEDTIKSIIDESKRNNCKLVLPTDVITATTFEDRGTNKSLDEVNHEEMILDIGEQSILQIQEILKQSKTVLWNGPLGFFEKDQFANGTNSVAKVIGQLTANQKIISIAGGGDTFAAIKKSNQENKFTYISTAGGAFLEWLEGKVLPGLKVLEKKN